MKKKTVLIVEDELDMRIFISTLLETSGYQPVMTRDGNEGMLKAQDICPDLIILDVMMPGEGGVQMYRQLKNPRNTVQYSGDHVIGRRAQNFFSLPEHGQRTLEEAYSGTRCVYRKAARS